MPYDCDAAYCQYACGDACSNFCSNYCEKQCSTGCASGCTGDCSGCTNCTGACLGSCLSACTSTCTGTCQGCTGCTSSCAAKCDNACTAVSQAEIIANIGTNIIRGNIIKANDFLELKSAIEKEYQRRNKAAPPAFSPVVSVGNKVELNAIIQVFDDCYNFNLSSSNDWRSTVAEDNLVIADKIQPCVTFIKTLATQITVK